MINKLDRKNSNRHFSWSDLDTGIGPHRASFAGIHVSLPEKQGLSDRWLNEIRIINIFISALFLLFASFFLAPTISFAYTIDSTGGDCSAIGTWNASTLTCTLTQDITETVVISSSNITLDGNGHTLSTTTPNIRGVEASNITSTTVRNLTIIGWQEGLYAVRSRFLLVENNIFQNNTTALYFSGDVYSYLTQHIIRSNTLENNFYSIAMYAGQGDTIEGNEIITRTDPSSIGVLFGGNNSSPNTIKNNTITGSGYAGIYFTDSDSNDIFGNTINGFENGVYTTQCGSAQYIKENTVRNNTVGLRIEGGSTNTVLHNNFQGNGTDLVLGFLPFGCGRGYVGYFSEPLPTGGNYWDRYDAEAKGCRDVNNDGICDEHFQAATATQSNGQGAVLLYDDLPWTRPNGWKLPPPTTTTECCSSVAFLPGLEGSRLYKPGALFEDQLWYPNTQNDVRQLALSPETGESVDPDIYTRDVIDEVVGTVNIYKTFLERMDAMVANGDIPQFEVFPYDWRKDQKDAATQLVSLGFNGDFYSMIQRLEEMASSSPTERVTLITHSNGGLVAKELVEILRQQGKPNIIDRIIMVAAPQLGTPKAILDILHGVDFIGPPNPELTRELAENMKSAYTLLPSREYFSRTGTPVVRPLVEFSTTTPVTQNFRNIYGDFISDYDTLRIFLRGENGTRTEPAANVTNEPNVLKEHFLQNAETRHVFQDGWTPPEGIEVIEIIGWGLDTLRGVKYEGRPNPPCVGYTNCTPKDLIDPQPLVTTEGDGTVVYSSAEALGGKRYWVAIKDYNKENFRFPEKFGRDHKNILEVTPLQELISTLLKHEATSTLPSFISSSRPSTSDTDKRLRIRVHSPVTLHLYDSLGRHTGPIPNQDPESDFELIEEQIPNTYYWQIGEGQYGGADGAAMTDIVLAGKESGTFTLDIEKIIGGNTANVNIYADIPVTASTTATLSASVGTSTALSVDIDGNGTTDFTITALETQTKTYMNTKLMKKDEAAVLVVMLEKLKRLVVK